MITEQILSVIRKYIFPLFKIDEIKLIYCNDKYENNHNVIECTCIYDGEPKTILELTKVKTIIQIMEQIKYILNSMNINLSYTITTLDELKEKIKYEENTEEISTIDKLNNCDILYCQREEYLDSFTKLRTRGRKHN